MKISALRLRSQRRKPRRRRRQYLVGFDGSGELRRQEDVLLLGRMVDVDQHPALGVWAVEGIVGVRAARLALRCLAASHRVVLAGAQMDHICGAIREGEHHIWTGR